MEWIATARLQYRFRRILGHVCASHSIRRVRPATVKAKRAKYHQTARRNNGWDTWLPPKVSDSVPRCFVSDMLNQSPNSNRGIGHDKRGSVFERHIIHGRPNGHVGRVGEPQIAAILMPRELDALLSRLGNVLILEQIGRIADRSLANFGHQVTKDVFRKSWCMLILLGNVISLAAM